MPNPLHDRLFAPHEGSERPFLHLADGTALPYAAFLDRAARFAAALGAAGLKPGDRLAAQVAKSPDALAVYAACVRTGVVFLPLNTAYTAEEVSYFLTDSEAAMFLCDPAREASLAPVAAASGARIETLDAAGGGSFAARAATLPPAADVADRAEGDLAALLYTSGTTGRSKGAMLSQGNLLSNALTLATAWEFGPEDVLLHALPIFHTHGLFVATNVILATGGAMIFLPGFDAVEALRLLPRATAMMGVPTFYTRLLDQPGLTREATAHMRLLRLGAAAGRDARRFRGPHRAPHPRTLRHDRDQHEHVEPLSRRPPRGHRRPAPAGGRASDHRPRHRRRGPAGRDRPDRGTRPERLSGLLADAEGYVTIVGRQKDLIISGGYNIYPKEVELVLDAQPGVLESAVVGVPHPDLGEAAVGVLVAAPGQAPDLGAIGAAMERALARYKQPRRLVVMAELPRNTMGKVQKNVLRDRFRDAFG